MKKIDWDRIIQETMRKTIGTAERRKQRRADREILERIHGLIQSMEEPPKEDEHHNFYKHYTIRVSWDGTEAHRIINANVFEKKGDSYRYIGSCKFTWRNSLTSDVKYLEVKVKALANPCSTLTPLNYMV